MAKKKSILFRKQFINGIAVAVPVYDSDREALDKIKGDFEASVHVYRNLKHHRKLMEIIRLCVKNDIFERIDNIDSLALEMIRRQFNDDVYAMLYILKWKFLPQDREIKPDGTVIERVSSVDFETVDQLEFQDFYAKCLTDLAEYLGCSVEDLEANHNTEI